MFYFEIDYTIIY